MFQQPQSPPQNFLPLFFCSYIFLFYPPSFLFFSFALTASTGRTGQYVSCPGAPVCCSPDSHLGHVSSRQPVNAGTLGTGQA